jgi:hypothetical protein
MKEYESRIPCPEGYTRVYKGSEGPIQRKGEDYDLYFYDVLDPNGNVFESYQVRDSMSVYPPFSKSVTVQKTFGKS